MRRLLRIQLPIDQEKYRQDKSESAKRESISSARARAYLHKQGVGWVQEHFKRFGEAVLAARGNSDGDLVDGIWNLVLRLLQAHELGEEGGNTRGVAVLERLGELGRGEGDLDAVSQGELE